MRGFFCIRRKTLTALGCLLAAAAIFYVVNYPAAIGAASAARQLPIYCVQRDQKLVSISFDAAWGMRIRSSSSPYWANTVSRPLSLWWGNGQKNTPSR